jgi:hypothetical protein
MRYGMTGTARKRPKAYAPCPEYTTAVLTVTAPDPELATVTYAKTGGTDQALFSLDTNTGVLALLSAPNFESPADAGTNNVYDVQVTATDQTAHSSVQNIAVTVTNVNEAPTITSSTTNSIPREHHRGADSYGHRSRAGVQHAYVLDWRSRSHRCGTADI